MKIRYLFIIASLLSTVFVQGATPAQELMRRLEKLSRKGIMFGHQDDAFYGTTWSTIGNMPKEMNETPEVFSDTYLVVGDYPAVMGFDLGGIELGKDRNLDGVPFDRIREVIRTHYRRGGIITISWHPRNPLTGGDAWDVKNSATVRSILPGGERHEVFREWMTRVGDFLKSLKTNDGRAIPVILRPWHEYNGSWFWWGEKLCSDVEFKGLWNMFQDFINGYGLKENIVWSCSPNLQGNWTMEHFLERWPGNDRVDLIGEDAYQWGTEKDFVEQTKADLKFLSDFAGRSGKLLAMTECGYRNSPDPTWWTRVLKPVLESVRLSYMLCWRNYYKEHFGVAPDMVTRDDFVEFYNDGNTLFLRDIDDEF